VRECALRCNPRSNGTRGILQLTAVVIATTLTFIGCAADSSPDELDQHAIEAQSPADLGDEGVPGEDPDARRGDKARNCAYVQWCDEPNSPRGTICKVYARCRPVNAATAEEYWQECKRDVRAVCGEPTYPFWFLPNE
jgi:hypothetical protein